MAASGQLKVQFPASSCCVTKFWNQGFRQSGAGIDRSKRTKPPSFTSCTRRFKKGALPSLKSASNGKPDFSSPDWVRFQPVHAGLALDRNQSRQSGREFDPSPYRRACVFGGLRSSSATSSSESFLLQIDTAGMLRGLTVSSRQVASTHLADSESDRCNPNLITSINNA